MHDRAFVGSGVGIAGRKRQDSVISGKRGADLLHAFIENSVAELHEAAVGKHMAAVIFVIFVCDIRRKDLVALCSVQCVDIDALMIFKPVLFVMEHVKLSEHSAVAHVMPVDDYIAPHGVKGA